MASNFIPTEMEIQTQAVMMFPDKPELQSSFIQGCWRTIWSLKERKDESNSK